MRRTRVTRQYVVLTCWMLAAWGCTSKPTAIDEAALRKRIARDRAELRAESISLWADRTLGSKPIHEYLQRRTALLWRDGISLELGPPDTSGTRNFVVLKQDGATVDKVASAFAVDPQGYFLTVAHAVTPNGDVLLLVPRDNLPPLEVQGTVIWTGWTGPRQRGSFDKQDIALVYAPTDTELDVMKWANAEAGHGTSVLACGAGNTSIRLSAGKVTAQPTTHATKDDGGPNSWGFVAPSSVDSIETDLPLVPGDSGGPVITDEGLVVGICTRTTSAPPQRSFLLKPDLEWLVSTIEAHQKAIVNNPEVRQPRARISMAGFARLSKEETAIEELFDSPSK